MIECKLEEDATKSEIEKDLFSHIIPIEFQFLTAKDRNGTINGSPEIVIGDRENRTPFLLQIQTSRAELRQGDSVDFIRSLGGSHRSQTGMGRRAMKRRLRESAGMEPVVAYGFRSGSSNFVRRVPQGSFSSVVFVVVYRSLYSDFDFGDGVVRGRHIRDRGI